MSQIAEADKYSNLNKTVMNMLNKPSFGWWAIFIFDMIFLAFGIYCFIYQVYTGLGVAGYSHPVLWGVYITDFVFWVGIAHSGTLISAVLFLFRAKFRMSIYRIAEAMTVFAVATAGLFPIIHLGRPWNFYWLLPYPNQRGLWVNFDSPLLLHVLPPLLLYLYTVLFHGILQWQILLDGIPQFFRHILLLELFFQD